MTEIENEGLFKQALRQGYNLFLGAGFSLESFGKKGRLPLGAEFEVSVRKEFRSLELPEGLDLPTICTIIKSRQAETFRDFCHDVFTVQTYHQLYTSILKTSIRNIFTTNVDSLIPKIVGNSDERYLHDVFLTGPGPSDQRCISYFALHGCVLHPNRELVFGTTEIASAYGDEPQLWNHFAQMLQVSPTVFWGYGMRDAPTLQAIHSAGKAGRANPESRWIVLHENERPNEAYYRALSLNIIYSNTLHLLEYINSVQFDDRLSSPSSDFSASRFPEYQIPTIANVPVRESAAFFEGAEASWYDVLQNIPTVTSHVTSIKDKIANGKSVLIQGVPASGKSTILKMIAISIPNYRKDCIYISGYMDKEKSEILAKSIGSARIFVFWDNVFDNVDSVRILMQCPNICVVFADRDYLFQFGYHKIDLSELDIYDCSELNRSDISRVVSSIPASMQIYSGVRQIERTDEPVSVFDVIQKVSRNSNISARIRKIFDDLENHEPIYRELFVLISYFHNARIAASFDAVASYCGLKGIGVMEVSNLIVRLGGIVREYEGAFGGQDQDYFQARSLIFAEQCMITAPSVILREVIGNVLRHISVIKIPHYSVFQRGAFRNEIFARAFPIWKDGFELYELVFQNALTEHPKPYIKQQSALYLAQKGKYREAFAEIDEAVRMSAGRIPTILHTQARIKFEANISADEDDEGYVYTSLLDSLDQLERCYNLDIRKQRHVEYYAKFALQLDDRFGDDESYSRLMKAESWVKKEIQRPQTTSRMRRLFKSIQSSIAR